MAEGGRAGGESSHSTPQDQTQDGGGLLEAVRDCRRLLARVGAGRARPAGPGATAAAEAPQTPVNGPEVLFELVRELEDLTRAGAAVSVRAQAEIDQGERAAQAAAGIPPGKRGNGVASDLARARKTSPYWGSRSLTSAKALAKEMPLTLAALADGRIDASKASDPSPPK